VIDYKSLNRNTSYIIGISFRTRRSVALLRSISFSTIYLKAKMRHLNEIECFLMFAVVKALKDGYEGIFVADAVGGRSQSAHRTAIERMAHTGAVPNTALAVI
jgi:isochorismate hydrolase